MHKGVGQFLDKKATLRKIIETNIGLNRISSWEDVDPTGLMVAPRDKVYRILSREKDYDSQAMVFFLRDYSGSMAGKPTELVVTQHILIYSWLLYQYEKRVETRFILHDTDAKEVPDFYTYYSSNVRAARESHPLTGWSMKSSRPKVSPATTTYTSCRARTATTGTRMEGRPYRRYKRPLSSPTGSESPSLRSSQEKRLWRDTWRTPACSKNTRGTSAWIRSAKTRLRYVS